MATVTSETQTSTTRKILLPLAPLALILTAFAASALTGEGSNKGPAAAIPLFYDSIVATTAAPPDIRLWYGENQQFGASGLPQRWINILGTVSDAEGDPIELTFRLNGGPERDLIVGPDKRRLIGEGDFNVEIHYSELDPGSNEVVLTAVDTAGNSSSLAVQLQYDPLPLKRNELQVRWSEVNDIQQVAQIVDGEWLLSQNGLTTYNPGYDRTVAFGDASWREYEVDFSFTVHQVDRDIIGDPIDVAPGLGLITRWQGHTDDPVRCPQLHCGWMPTGASSWYDWGLDQGTWTLGGNRGSRVVDASGERIDENVAYDARLRVETIPGYGTFYNFKVWESSEQEPAQWDLAYRQGMWEPQAGSALFVAHHVDTTLGDISITLLEGSRWDWFTLLSGFVAQAPLYIVSLIGIALAWIYRSRKPGISRITLIAASALLGIAILGAFLRGNLPSILHEQGWETGRIALTIVASESFEAFVFAISWGLLLLALFRREPPMDIDERHANP